MPSPGWVSLAADVNRLHDAARLQLLLLENSNLPRGTPSLSVPFPWVCPHLVGYPLRLMLTVSMTLHASSCCCSKTATFPMVPLTQHTLSLGMPSPGWVPLAADVDCLHDTARLQLLLLENSNLPRGTPSLSIPFPWVCPHLVGYPLRLMSTVSTTPHASSCCCTKTASKRPAALSVLGLMQRM